MKKKKNIKYCTEMCVCVCNFIDYMSLLIFISWWFHLFIYLLTNLFIERCAHIHIPHTWINPLFFSHLFLLYNYGQVIRKIKFLTTTSTIEFCTWSSIRTLFFYWIDRWVPAGADTIFNTDPGHFTFFTLKRA